MKHADIVAAAATSITSASTLQSTSCLHQHYTVSQKKGPTLKRYSSKLWIDFDDIWRKYSKVSRIEFACFSFHVGLLVTEMMWDSTTLRQQRQPM